MGQVLEGVRVLELAQGVAGPYCGKIFADFGAEVVKVELPGVGDVSRSFGPFPDGATDPEQSAAFLHLNTNKRSITADLSTPDDADLVRRLAARSDIVIESYSPGKLDAWGLGFDALRAAQPKIVLTSVTPFGQSGP